MKNIDISIIIVSFNTKFFLGKCLKSISSSDRKEGLVIETIVVDNNSTDGSVEELKKNKNIIAIFNDKNVGFAAANNIGLKVSKGKFVLLLNSDTELGKDTLVKMIDFFKKHPEAGAATAKLELASGKMDPACHRGFPTPWASLTYFSGLEKLFPGSRIFGGYHEGYKNLNEAHEIDSPSGAFFMVKREVIEKAGLLDEDYFMYGEDLDWAYRMKEAGFQIWFNPEATVLHHKKQSGRESLDPKLRKQTEQHFYKTMKLFYRKHFLQRYSPLITFMVIFFIDLKLYLLKIKS